MSTRNRIVRLFVIVTCFYLIITSVQAIWQLLGTGSKVTEREQKLAALTAEQKRLIAEASRSGTFEYLEQVAYDKLGMSKPGEKLIIIPQELLATPGQVTIVSSEPNWKKWERLLFN